MSGGNFEGRQRNFMKLGDLQELKLKREWEGVELRKSTRTEHFMKKRRIQSPVGDLPPCPAVLDSVLAGFTTASPLEERYVQLELLTSGGRADVCHRIVSAGIVPTLLREFRSEQAPRVIRLKAAEVLCDLASTLESTALSEAPELLEAAFTVFQRTDELQRLAVLIIGNVLPENYSRVPAEKLEEAANRMMDSLELPCSDESETDVKLFAIATFFDVESLSPAVEQRIVAVLQKFCGLPYSGETASTIVRGLSQMPEKYVQSLADTRVINFLKSHILLLPWKPSAFKLLSAGMSTGAHHIESFALPELLSDLIHHPTPAVRRNAYSFLEESLHFYRGCKSHVAQLPLWKLAVQGVSDTDEKVQGAATRFYLAYEAKYYEKLMEVAEELIAAMTTVQRVSAPEVQLVWGM